jgi:DNA-binding Xre family transcriptional regulator
VLRIPTSSPEPRLLVSHWSDLLSIGSALREVRPKAGHVSTPSEVIARNARALRAAGQLRQVDVAQRAGISRPVLSVIESGTRRITIEDMLALCRGLGVSVDRLLEGADPDDLRTLGL